MQRENLPRKTNEGKPGSESRREDMLVKRSNPVILNRHESLCLKERKMVLVPNKTKTHDSVISKRVEED